MTTVGYGEITPKSDAGRAIGIVVMLGGIRFLATLTAALAQRFLSVGAAEQRRRPGSVERSGRVERELAALHERLERLERDR